MESLPFDQDNPDRNSPLVSLEDEDTTVIDPGLETTQVNPGAEAAGEEELSEEEIRKQIGDHVNKLAESIQKAETAHDTMDKIARKRRFYQALGERALEGAVGARPKAATWSERFMERRVDEKADKRNLAQAEKARMAGYFGGEATNTMGFKGVGAIEARLQRAEKDYSKGKLTPAELRTEKLMIKGSMGKPTELERIRYAEAEYKKDKITLEDLNDEVTLIKQSQGRLTEREMARYKQPGGKSTEPLFAGENRTQKRLRRRAEGAQKKVKRAVNQPIASRLRDREFNKANEAFNKHSAEIEAHLEAIRQLHPNHPLLPENQEPVTDPAEEARLWDYMDDDEFNNGEFEPAYDPERWENDDDDEEEEFEEPEEGDENEYDEEPDEDTEEPDNDNAPPSGYDLSAFHARMRARRGLPPEEPEATEPEPEASASSTPRERRRIIDTKLADPAEPAERHDPAGAEKLSFDPWYEALRYTANTRQKEEKKIEEAVKQAAEKHGRVASEKEIKDALKGTNVTMSAYSIAKRFQLLEEGLGDEDALEQAKAVHDRMIHEKIVSEGHLNKAGFLVNQTVLKDGDSLKKLASEHKNKRST